jgi:hypothetical protein
MRKQELENWAENGGDLPDDLTEDEKSYLKGLGWEVIERYSEDWKWGELHLLKGKPHGKSVEWFCNGQKQKEEHCLHGEYQLYEDNYHHGKQHGTYKVWKEDGTLEAHKEHAYGVLLKDFLK